MHEPCNIQVFLTCEPKALRLATQGEAEFDFGFTRRETQSDITDKRIRIAISDTDLKPCAGLEKLSASFFLKESGGFII